MANEKRNHFWLINLKIGESKLPPGRWQVLQAWSHRRRTYCRAASSSGSLGEGREGERVLVVESMAAITEPKSPRVFVPIYSGGGKCWLAVSIGGIYCFYSTRSVSFVCFLRGWFAQITHKHTDFNSRSYFCRHPKYNEDEWNSLWCLKY